MKIGIIHPDLNVGGGAEAVTISLLDALSKTKHKVTLYTYSNLATLNDTFALKKIKKLSFPYVKGIAKIINDRRLVESSKNEDMILIMSTGLILNKLKTNTVLFCNSTFQYDLNYIKSESKGRFKLYHDFLKKDMANKFDKLKKDNVSLIANSEFTCLKLKENFGKDSIVVYPPVILDIFRNNNNKKNDDKKGCITVARYSEEKNLDFAVKIFKKIPIKYRLIGNAQYKSQYNMFYRLQDFCKNDKNIELLCNVNRDTITISFLSSKVYFHTSEETFGMSVVEGIAAGCVPIVPDNTAHKETVPYDQLRYQPDDADEARELLLRANRGEFDEYVPKLQKHIESFDQSIFKRKIIEYVENYATLHK